MASFFPFARGRRQRDGAPSAASTPSWTIRDQIQQRGLTAGRALALGDALEHEGKLLDAVEALRLANRMHRDASLERRLVRLRRAAFACLDFSTAPSLWPPDGTAEVSDLPAAMRPASSGGAHTFVVESPGPPVIAADDLTAGAIRRGILAHGSVLVRGLVAPQRVRHLVEVIDRAFAAYDAHAAGAPIAKTTPWFDPLEDVPQAESLRGWVRRERGVFAGDSPRAFNDFLETVSDLGLDRLIAAYLGERPALSLEKCTLRRAEPEQTGNAWHQDGAFIGRDVRSLNVWFSLSHCGRTAPGLDIVPARLERILPVGTPGAVYDWDVAESLLRESIADLPIWRPQFAPGDALFFDHLCVHRTALDAAMSERRWAIESWFFAPSVYPATQTPLVV